MVKQFTISVRNAITLIAFVSSVYTVQGVSHNFSGLNQLLKDRIFANILPEEGDVRLIDTDSQQQIKQKKQQRQLMMAQIHSEELGQQKSSGKINSDEAAEIGEKLDVKDDRSLQVPLEYLNDALYVGTLYIGTPQSQPTRVVFDTGSEYLAITSALCDDKTAQNYKFKVYDSAQNGFISKKVENRCHSMSYDMHKSQTSKILSRSSSKLAYGSAQMQGFVWEDTACLQQLNPTNASDKSPAPLSIAQMKENKCTPFQFLSLYKVNGLEEEGADGILGLSPHKNDDKRHMHYLGALKDSGIIDKAIVSFNLATRDIDDQSYALFGGVNSTQIIDGVKGLRTFPNFPNWLGTWALEGQKVFYGDKLLENTVVSYPAIIDTGTSQMQVPPHIFQELYKSWDEALSQVQPHITCPENEAFCTSDIPCKDIEKKVPSIGLVLSGTKFVLPPSAYLYQVNDGKCYFILSECKLDGKNKDIYILGAAFLQHFYSAFDFDTSNILIGINSHAADGIKIIDGQKG